MAAPSRSSASWERVLAAMEAEAARAAALLISDDASGAAGIEYDGQDAAPALSLSPDEATGVPVTWRLPVPAGATGGGPGLTGGAAARAVAGYAAAAAGATSASTAGPAPAPTGGATDRPGSGQAAEQHAGPAAEQHAESASASTPTPHSATASTPDPYAAGDVELPNLADMPPLTPEQFERFTALQARISELQTELAAAMTEAEAVLARPVARRPGPQPRPELVDRRL